MPPHETYSVVEMAKIDAGITGLLAGFAIAIVILLIERHIPSHSDKASFSLLEEAGVAVFLTAAFVSLLAAFLFAHVAANFHNANRAFLMSAPAFFAFGVSAVLFIYGVLILVYSLQLAFIFDIARTILGSAIAIAIMYYLYMLADIIAVMHNTLTREIFARPGTIVPLLLASVGLPACVALWRAVRRSRPLEVTSRSFRVLVTGCSVGSIVVGAVTLIISVNDPSAVIPTSVMLLFALTFSILMAWIILCIPNRLTEATRGEVQDTMSVGQSPTTPTAATSDTVR